MHEATIYTVMYNIAGAAERGSGGKCPGASPELECNIKYNKKKNNSTIFTFDLSVMKSSIDWTNKGLKIFHFYFSILHSFESKVSNYDEQIEKKICSEIFKLKFNVNYKLLLTNI